MSLELLGRIQQELSITGSAIYETVLALAERANRKVQVLKLHSHASSLLSQIEEVHGQLGRQIATLCARRHPTAMSRPYDPISWNQFLVRPATAFSI